MGLLKTREQVEEFIKENKIKHFKAQEFVCKHCGKVIIESKLITILEELREHIKKPVVITSGYRCPEYNEKVGGVPNSAHTKGLAVDVKCVHSRTRFKILEFLLKNGINRIGVGKDFIHFDLDKEKPSFVVWHYYGKE